MLYDSILFIGLAQSLFAAVVLASSRQGSVSNRILIACLLTFALKFVVFAMHREHGEYFNLEFSLPLIPMTFGPFIYLYTVYLIERRTAFRRRDWLHFLPFAVMVMVYFVFLNDKVSFRDTQYFNRDPFLWIRMVYGLTFFTSIVVYSTVTFMKLRHYRKNLNAQFRFADRQVKLMWLNFIPFLFGLFFLAYFVTGGINAVSFRQVIDTTTLSHFGLTVIAFTVSYFGLRQPSLFHPAFWEQEIRGYESGNGRKEARPRFTDKAAREFADRLQGIMEDRKPYLNPELTLQELADLCSLSKHELTDLLNMHIGKNFFSYVNEYRIQAVLERFDNPDFRHFTIIAIAYDCGFNSKSTFNSIFKQHTGRTPSEYKKSLENRSGKENTGLLS